MMIYPPQLLRLGAVSLFALMIIGAVMYRDSISEEQVPIEEDHAFSSGSDYFRHKKVSSEPWYDRVAFLRLFGFDWPSRLSSSKSGIIFPPRTLLTKQAVYDLLEMRYDAVRMSEAESAIFHQTFSSIHQFPKLRFAKELAADQQDSVDAMLYTKVGAAQLSGLSVKETNRFNELLHERRKWRQQQKTDFVDIRDTIRILQTLKLEKYSGNVSQFMYSDYWPDFPEQ